jgi:uncharacterized protein YcgI (DUF1989 family)
MGRVLFSITEDTCGSHDTLSGCSNVATNSAKYGEESFYRSARDNFLLALAKRNMGKRDIWFGLSRLPKLETLLICVLR